MLKMKLVTGILTLVFVCVICADNNYEKNEKAIHHFMTSMEKRMVFGSEISIPEYEVLHPIDESHSRYRRDTGGSLNAAQQNKIINLSTKDGLISLRVERQSQLMASQLKIEIWEPEKRNTRSLLRHPDCHYQGKVDGFPDSIVALSHCSSFEMRAIVHISPAESYVIVPVPRRLRKKRELEGAGTLQGHILYKASIGSSCGLHSKSMHIRNEDASNLVYPKDDLFISDNENVRLRRDDKRSSLNRTMETAVFVDDVLFSLMEAENPDDPIEAILGIVFAMINSVQIIYSQASLSAQIRIVLVKIVIMKPGSKGPPKEEGNIRSYLKSFCTWQAKYNPQRDSEEDHWDHALMLTGIDLFMDKPDNTVVIGLAWVSGMCYRHYSCSLNEGTTFESVYVISHELGHNLGMQHDGDDNNTCSENDFIMSSSLGPGKTTWSSCSNDYLKKFLDSEDAQCLYDLTKFKKDLDYRSTLLPGQLYSAASQCHLTYGNKYRPYVTEKKPFEDLCRELWCANGTLARRAHPALAGTKCGIQKICLHGKCTDNEVVMSKLDSANIFPEESGTDNSISL